MKQINEELVLSYYLFPLLILLTKMSYRYRHLVFFDISMECRCINVRLFGIFIAKVKNVLTGIKPFAIYNFTSLLSKTFLTRYEKIN